MRRMVLALTLAMLPGRLLGADLAVDAERLASLKESLKGFKERLAPAPVDAEAVNRLFERLMKDGQMGEHEIGAALSYARCDDDGKGGGNQLMVSLIEVAPSPQKGFTRDLVYRRVFTHLEGVSKRVRYLPDGSGEVDEWLYIVSLDGKIQSVYHKILVLIPPEKGGPIDYKRSRAYRMSPADTHVLRRWQTMTEAFLRMGPLADA